MPKDISRLRRVGEQLQRQLALLFQSEIKDPRFQQITIADVKPSNDLSFAKVYYTLFDASQREQVQPALDKAAGRIRHALKNHIEMRVIPKLRFVYDESTQYGADLSALINKAVSQDEQKRSASSPVEPVVDPDESNNG